MRKIVLSLIIFSFLFAAAAFAQEIDLPSPVLTPDSNFYFLKSWKESIQTFFTFGAENKAKQFLHLAEARLAEYRKMVEKGKMEIAEKTLEKYEKQLSRALEKAEKVKEGGKDAEKLKEEISEKILKHQEVLEGVLEKVSEEARKRIENAIESSRKGLEKVIEAVTGENREEFRRKAEEIKMRVEEKLELLGPKAPEDVIPREEKTTEKSIESPVCIQVITPAMSSEGTCKEFPTPCDVPSGWKEVEKCQVPVQSKSIQPAQPKPVSSPIPNTSLSWVTGTLQLEFPSIFLTGQSIMMRPPGSPMPQPVAEQRPTLQSMNDDEWCAKKRMRVDDYGVKYILEMLGVVTVKVGSVDCRACHIRKFSEGGVLVAERWDDMYLWYLQKLSGKWACEKSVNYKNFMGEWVDYYQISESWSPRNFYYQCVKKEGAYVSGNADFCEKDVPATAILPPPTATPALAPTQTAVACYIGEICKMGSREECSAKGGKAVDESSCPAAAGDVSCQIGKMEDYRCPNGSLIKWQCQCRYDESSGDERRDCTVNPAESCSLSVSSPPLTINSIQTKYDTWQQGRPGEEKSISMQIFWITNKPTTSWIEYGLTTAYGSKVSSYAPSPNYGEHGTYDLSGMQRNTTYHFRITAEDAAGNKIISDDYTFTTGL